MNNPVMEELPNGMFGFMDHPDREPLTKEQFAKLKELQGGTWVVFVEPKAVTKINKNGNSD